MYQHFHFHNFPAELNKTEFNKDDTINHYTTKLVQRDDETKIKPIRLLYYRSNIFQVLGCTVPSDPARIPRGFLIVLLA